MGRGTSLIAWSLLGSLHLAIIGDESSALAVLLPSYGKIQ
jgi:hypothetical protein